MAAMNRFLPLLVSLSAAVLLAPAIPACASDPSGCDQGLLAQSPAFFLPFEDRVDEAGCTVTAFIYDSEGGRQRMQCVAYVDDCLCRGGGLPGVYEVVVYDRDSTLQIDDAEVTVTAAAAPDCRESNVTRPFDGAFRHSYYGAGGAAGAGGEAGAAGAAGD